MITVFVAFVNIVPIGIDVLGAGMEMGVFCKGKCSLIICEQRCSTDLRQHYFSHEHAEPHALVGCLGAHYILSITC